MTSSSMTRLLHFGYKVVDIGTGDMFPIFPIHESLQAYSGVDFSPPKKKISRKFSNLQDFTLETRLMNTGRDCGLEEKVQN